MRIGFNCLHVVPGRLGGLETYIHGLLEIMGKAPSANELIIFCSSRYKSEFSKYADRYTLKDLDVDVDSARRRIQFEQFALPQEAARQSIDVLHSSGYTAPITRRCKTLMTVHDLNYVEIPHMIRRSHGMVRWAAIRMLGPMSMKQADRILTVSHHVRHQITRLFHIPPERIATVYNQSPCDFSKMSAIPVTLPSACASGFLLYVASWLPHKNHKVLFQAWAEARQRKIDLPPLVLAGLHLRSNVQRSSIRAALQRYDLEEQVYCVEQHLSLENLADLYQRARAFVFPSLYEGFGIPVLEAMSAKLPVICSGIEPLNEVVAGNALTFSPFDSAELLERLVAVNEDHELRVQLARRGYDRYLSLQRASESASAELLRVYESLVE